MKFISIANRKFSSRARSIPRASGDCMASRRSCIRHSRPVLNRVSSFFCLLRHLVDRRACRQSIHAPSSGNTKCNLKVFLVWLVIFWYLWGLSKSRWGNIQYLGNACQLCLDSSCCRKPPHCRDLGRKWILREKGASLWILCSVFLNKRSSKILTRNIQQMKKLSWVGIIGKKIL